MKHLLLTIQSQLCCWWGVGSLVQVQNDVSDHQGDQPEPDKVPEMAGVVAR